VQDSDDFTSTDEETNGPEIDEDVEDIVEEGGGNSDDTSGEVSDESNEPRKKHKANIAQPRPSTAEKTLNAEIEHQKQPEDDAKESGEAEKRSTHASSPLTTKDDTPPKEVNTKALAKTPLPRRKVSGLTANPVTGMLFGIECDTNCKAGYIKSSKEMSMDERCIYEMW